MLAIALCTGLPLIFGTDQNAVRVSFSCASRHAIDSKNTTTILLATLRVIRKHSSRTVGESAQNIHVHEIDGENAVTILLATLEVIRMHPLRTVRQTAQNTRLQKSSTIMLPTALHYSLSPDFETICVVLARVVRGALPDVNSAIIRMTDVHKIPSLVPREVSRRDSRNSWRTLAGTKRCFYPYHETQNSSTKNT